ncbi:bile acid:sodium symporter family protein [Thiomicrorhabdus sp. zzn3]|uniref:bile acid:sodium symporter family protein n=1 Tax=Thiomicrorhabdus sp. zzn3 TaxID=3039775 RepID=UPI0024369FC1|nr:bile acid:sodium symporter family protein [Thiomicrorhabdus sp. zzn3]MDG6777805.1 bile acid:sodium symporter family protein [Thiomicrorhabdus sp. zzn3]
MQRLSFLFTFPMWALFAALLGFYWPHYFVGLKEWIVPLLMVIVFCTGLNLRLSDFERVWYKKEVVAIGAAAQFGVMPLAAFLLSLAFGLSDEWTIGMMLVGATAGGTASSVMTYLARGDVALSVSMTLVSTVLAVGLMPLLTWIYLDKSFDVPVSGMFLSLLKLILLPLSLGMLVNHFMSHWVKPVRFLLPLYSMGAIALIIATVVALNHMELAHVGAMLIVAVMLHNLIGLFSGYWITRKLGYDSVIARTVALEVGMQNSGLSVALALQYFSAASALPGALFSIWHNLSGAFFASYWQSKSK